MSIDDTSVYPQDLDGYATLPLRRNLIDEIRAEDHNRLRNAIIKIQQELGIQPSGTYATVAARLDDIGDVRTIILAHIANPTDAHDASAISVLDTADNYFEDDVENVLAELATLLPPSPDVVGDNNSKVPNHGIPSFLDGYGVKHVFNISSSTTIAKRTQPDPSSGIQGLYIIEVSANTDNGVGTLRQKNGSPATFSWQAPGDTEGPDTNLDSLQTGETAILVSGTSTKRIKVAKTSAPYKNSTPEDDFEVYAMEGVKGYFSFPAEGFKFSQNIVHTAPTISDDSRLQFMIRGMVFPADRGTLVLQRKLRGVSEYYPIAVLDLTENFDDDLRDTGQLVYTPALTQFDHFILYDRLPVHDDYSLFDPTADGTDPYEDYENTFTRMQVAKYLVPVSVPSTDTVGGTLEYPSIENTTNAEINATVSAYRIIHYKDGITDFTGNPSADDIYSLADFDEEDNANTGIQFSNLFVDWDAPNLSDSAGPNYFAPTRPGIEHIELRPANQDVPNDDATLFVRRSGVRYYNSSVNDLFGIELRTNNAAFANTFLLENILRFETRHFNFPSAQTGTRTLEVYDNLSSTVIKYGADVDIEELALDGYWLSVYPVPPDQTSWDANKISASNLPSFGDQAFYIVNSNINAARRITPLADIFSTRAFVTGRMYDPWGPGDGYDAYGFDTSARILINTHPVDRATADTEWFTDESKRVGTTTSDVRGTISENFDFNTDVGQFTNAYGATIDGYEVAYWDPNVALLQGSLQCGGRLSDLNDESNIAGLIFPQDNYRDDGPNRLIPHQPIGVGEINQQTSYDDPSYQVDSIYQRLFSLGYAIGGAKLRITSAGGSPVAFNDIRAGNANRFAKIEVKIPGNDTNSTGWMDIGKLYQTGKYENGDGALNGEVTGGAGDFTVPFTFGGRNNANAGYMVAVRVTYFGGQFDDAKNRIITMIKMEA